MQKFFHFIDFIEFLINLKYRFSWAIKIFIEDKKKEINKLCLLNIHFFILNINYNVIRKNNN